MSRLFNAVCAAGIIALFSILSPSAPGAERTIKIRDYTRRGFAPDLVRYRLEDGADTRNLRVRDAGGQQLPHQVNGSRPGHLHNSPLEIAPVKANLKSQVYPGVGVVFRAHQGPDETYMFLRAGFMWKQLKRGRV